MASSGNGQSGNAGSYAGNSQTGEDAPTLTPEDFIMLQTLLARLPSMQTGVANTPASVQEPEATTQGGQNPIDKSLQEEWEQMRQEPTASGLNSTAAGWTTGANKAPPTNESSASGWQDPWESNEGTCNLETLRDATGRLRTVKVIPLEKKQPDFSEAAKKFDEWQKAEDAKEFERGRPVTFDAKGGYSSGATASQGNSNAPPPPPMHDPTKVQLFGNVQQKSPAEAAQETAKMLAAQAALAQKQAESLQQQQATVKGKDAGKGKTKDGPPQNPGPPQNSGKGKDGGKDAGKDGKGKDFGKDGGKDKGGKPPGPPVPPQPKGPAPSPTPAQQQMPVPPKAEAKATASPEKRVKTDNSDASASAGMQDGNGAMTDGSKRRHEAVETSYEWDDDDFSLVGTEETMDSPPEFAHYAGGFPDTFGWIACGDWSNPGDPIVKINYQHADTAIPMPAWIRDTYHWSCTVITLKQWAKEKITFHDFVLKVFNKDEAACKYGKMMIARFRKHMTSVPKTQGPDLCAFLLHLRVDVFIQAGKSYYRQFNWRRVDDTQGEEGY